jgi:PAS domain S-box-containing protein
VESPATVVNGRADRPNRGRSAARRLAVMVAVAVVAFVGAGGVLASRTLDHARVLARQDAAFQADLAAKSIDAGLTLAQTTLAGIAGSFPTAALLADPHQCQLLFAGLGPFSRGHIDVVRNNGQVACSSLAAHGAPAGATHAGATWLSGAATPSGSWIAPPFTDHLTGRPAIAVVMRLPGPDGKPLALIALVLELSPLADDLAATYAGPRGFTFPVVANGSTVSAPAASSGPRRSGESLLTGSAQVTALPWRIDAGIAETEALGSTRALLVRGGQFGVAAMVLVLLLLFLVNRKIAIPLDRLAVAEQKLRASEERLRLLLHGARDYAIVMLDADGRVASWSPSAQLLDGYPQDEILGRPYDIFFTSAEVVAGEPTEILESAASTGRHEHEGVRVRHDGSRYWARTVITARRDAEGVLQGYVTVAHDATVRREVELATIRVNAELEQRVEERTTQLEVQAAELHAANAELRAFSYSVSHDLRAPLRAIAGFANILSDRCTGTVPAEVGHYATRIVANAENLTHMVEALLGLSATQRATMNATTLDLTAMTRAAWDELEPELEGRSVEFVLPPLPAAHGDPRLIRQVLTNLLENAVKYTKKKDRALIEMGSKVTAEETVYFVRDNGAGFDMRRADEVFQVFRRLHDAQDYPGTGIGLASVQRIVARHGGRAWAEGEPDRGATFYFTLSPVSRTASNAAPSAPIAAPEDLASLPG